MVSAHFSSLNMFFGCIGLLLVAAQYVMCTDSFSIELMHRDSPRSSLYDPTSTPSSRLDASIKRSASRADYLHSVNSRSPNSPLNIVELEDPYANLTSFDTEFLITAFIGDQYKEVQLVMNPGGSLVWIACNPCNTCYKTVYTRFHPKSSHSYGVLGCDIKECIEAGYTCGRKNKCTYTHSYGDNSMVTGFLSSDRVRLSDMNGRDIHLLNMMFGCTHKTSGHFPKDSLGYMGLGGGSLSFVRQLGLRGYQMKFSYCLPASFKKKSKMYFGSSGSVIGDDTQGTPMEVTNLYKVTVDSITVGGEVLIVSDKFVMNAGTFLTYVDSSVLENLIRMVTKITPLPIIETTPESTFKLCYSVTTAEQTYLLPEITLNFAFSAYFVLYRKNAYLTFPDKKAICLAIVEKKSDGLSIIGSHAQVNHRIGFDLENEMLFFRPEICQLF